MRKKEKQRNPRLGAIILSIMALLCLAGTTPLLGCTYSTTTYYDCEIHSTEDDSDASNHVMLNCGNYACFGGHGYAECGQHCICMGGRHEKLNCGYYACASMSGINGHGYAECK